MSSDGFDHTLVQLYRNVARERSPALLDERILAAAAHRARVRNARRRLAFLASAAAVAGLAAIVPQWRTAHLYRGSHVAESSIDEHSPLADALRSLRVPTAETSAVSRCLRRDDLCSNEAPAHREQ